MKERSDIELSAAILGRHLTVYMWPRNSSVVSKLLFWEKALHWRSTPGAINPTSTVFVKKKSLIDNVLRPLTLCTPRPGPSRSIGIYRPTCERNCPIPFFFLTCRKMKLI